MIVSCSPYTMLCLISEGEAISTRVAGKKIPALMEIKKSINP